MPGSCPDSQIEQYEIGLVEIAAGRPFVIRLVAGKIHGEVRFCVRIAVEVDIHLYPFFRPDAGIDMKLRRLAGCMD